jgi:hypothetical protein
MVREHLEHARPNARARLSALRPWKPRVHLGVPGAPSCPRTFGANRSATCTPPRPGRMRSFGTVSLHEARTGRGNASKACGWCGRLGAPTIVLPHVRICFNCRRYRQYHPRTCPGCADVRALGYLDAHGAVVCSACAGHAGPSSVFACTECGREDRPYGMQRCAHCFLRERLTVLLTDPTTGQIHEQLRPVFDAILDGEHPQSGIYWLRRRQRIGPGLLAAMARGEIAISHHSFNDRPMDRVHNYVRDLLVAVGVLEPYEPLIERMIPWLATLGETLDPHHARLVTRTPTGACCAICAAWPRTTNSPPEAASGRARGCDESSPGWVGSRLAGEASRPPPKATWRSTCSPSRSAWAASSPSSSPGSKTPD